MVLCFLWLTPGARSASALVHTFTPISSVWQCEVLRVTTRSRSSQHKMNGAAGSTQLRCQQRPSLTVSHAGGVKALG